MDEQELIRMAQSGDHEAFSKLHTHYEAHLSALVRFYLGRTDVADVTQDIWLQVYRKLWQLEEGEKFRPWLNKLVFYQCLNHRKALARHRQRELYMRADDWRQIAEFVADPGGYPEELLERKELRRHLSVVLDELPGEIGLVLRMRYLRELTYDEIAQMSALPVSTVKWRLHTGRKLLRSKLAQQITRLGRGYTWEK